MTSFQFMRPSSSIEKVAFAKVFKNLREYAIQIERGTDVFISPLLESPKTKSAIAAEKKWDSIKWFRLAMTNTGATGRTYVAEITFPSEKIILRPERAGCDGRRFLDRRQDR